MSTTGRETTVATATTSTTRRKTAVTTAQTNSSTTRITVVRGASVGVPESSRRGERVVRCHHSRYAPDGRSVVSTSRSRCWAWNRVDVTSVHRARSIHSVLKAVAIGWK
jgi:hypothetical protein